MLRNENLIKGEVLLLPIGEGILKIGASYTLENGNEVGYWLVKAYLQENKNEFGDIQQTVAYAHFLCDGKLPALPLPVAIQRHKELLSKFLEVKPRDIDKNMFARYAESVTHLNMGFHNAWKDSLEEFLSPHNPIAETRRELISGIVNSHYPNLPALVEMLSSGIPLEVINSLEQMPSAWIKQAAGPTVPLALDNAGQEIYAKLFEEFAILKEQGLNASNSLDR